VAKEGGKEVKPYYQDSAVTIYHGDCREMMPEVGSVDLILTDSPYGIGADSAAAKNEGKWGWKFYGKSDWDSLRPEGGVFLQMLHFGKNSIIWGGNYFADLLPPSMGWLCWDKGQRGFSLADFELAWTSFSVAARAVVVPRGRALQDGKVHPTQKSLDVMNFCIVHADARCDKPNSTILDPFMGSGTTLRAAKDLGRKAIGIEIEERYCEIAAKRMAQEVLFSDDRLS